MPHDVFISYATKDKPMADAVCVAVETRGFRCWIAPRDVLAGMPYGEAIIDAIQGSRVMVVVFSSNANASTHIPKEVERATADGVTIIPFRIEAVLPAKSLNYFLASLHWLDALTAPLDPHLEKLADAIAQTLPKGAARAEAVAPPVSRPAPAEIPEEERAAWWSGKAFIALAAVVLLVALAGAGWFYRSHVGGGETIDSLAVLPLVNGSGDPKMEFLSDGISESLINSLSQLPNLKVMSRESAFHYKGKETDAKTIGDALGVRAVFEGRVTQVGDDLAISAELIDARDNSHIWGEQYNRKAADIFALQSDIAMEITTALRTRLSGDDAERLTKSYTASPEAYQLYLTGRYWANKSNEEGFRKGIEYFQQAIAKDPAYALAYAGLADCHVNLSIFLLAPPQEGFPKAKEAAQKALELDDSLAEAHVTLANIEGLYDWDWSAAEAESQRALALNPNLAIAHREYGNIMWNTGRLNEATAETKRARDLDPLSLEYNLALGLSFYVARNYDQAIAQGQRVLELDPNFIPGHVLLCLAYLQESKYQDSIQEIDKALAISPNSMDALSALGYAYAVAGRKADAQKVLDRLGEMSKQKYVAAESRTVIYAAMGEKDQAFEWLQKAYEDHSITAGGPFSMIKVHPAYDPLRSDPRWANLLHRMNLQR